MSSSRHTGRDRRSSSAETAVHQTPFGGTRWEVVGFSTLFAFLVVCLLGGGSSRGDTLSLIYLRPAAIVCIAILLLIPVQRDWRRVFWPLLFIAAAAMLILVQLIPLPPSVWQALPGRAIYAQAADVAGFPQPWRPLSVTPDFTRAALLWLLPPLVAVIGFASIREDQRRVLIPVIAVGACLSAIVGLIQLGGGSGSPGYLYRFTHQGFPVGFFANRNHEAVLLAIVFPLVSAWAMLPGARVRNDRTRALIAFGLATFMVPSILITGSRAGFAIGVVGAIAGLFLAAGRLTGSQPLRRRVPLMIAIALIPLILVVLAFLQGRAVSIDRLAGQDLSETEMRVRNLPLLIDIARSYFPTGSGFGSFDVVFRTFEPDPFLDRTYFNRAHNDFLEIAITGGLPGLALLAGFLIWWGLCTARAFRRGRMSSKSIVARAAAVSMLMLFLASLVDYPLGTPLMSAIFAIMACWLQQAGDVSERRTSTLLSPYNELPRVTGGGRDEPGKFSAS